MHGVSLHELRKKVLSRDLLWDDKNYPEEDIVESNYDSDKTVHVPYKKTNEQYNDET